MSLKSKFIALVFSSLLMNSCLSAQQQTKVPYAQLSSLKTQIPSETNRIVRLEQVDGSHNIDASSPEKIVIKESGSYFIAAAGQVGAERTGEAGFVDMWLMVNGNQVANTGVRQSVSDIKLTAVLLSQAILELKAGDVLTIGFFANRAGFGLISFPHIQQEPAIPSIIFSVYKIGA